MRHLVDVFQPKWLIELELKYSPFIKFVWQLHSLTSRGSTRSTGQKRTKDLMKPSNSGGALFRSTLPAGWKETLVNYVQKKTVLISPHISTALITLRH